MVRPMMFPDDDLIHDRSIDNWGEELVDETNSDEATAIISAADQTHDSAETDQDDASVDGARKPRKRVREVSLSPVLLAVLSDDDDGGDAPTSRSYEGRPDGAKTYFDFVTYLEEIDPAMARIEEMILIGRVTARDAAARAGCDAATLSRRRARIRVRFKEWREESPFNREESPFNKERAIDRLVYRLWQEGHTNRTIETRLRIYPRDVRRILREMIPRYSHAMPRYQPECASGPLNPFADEAQARQDISRRQRGPYKVGDTIRERILVAIPKLALVKGEAPTSREIQDQLGARSNVNYHLAQMKAQGLIRPSPDGYGYEIVASKVVSCANFKSKT